MRYQYNNSCRLIYDGVECGSEEIIKFKQKAVLMIDNAIKYEADMVGIAMDKSPFLFVLMMSCLEKKIPFINLDCSQPSSRLKAMVDKVDIKVILADESHKDILSDVKIISYDDELLPVDNNYHKVSELAYILFTSGSTGIPKAVKISRANLWNFIEGMKREIAFEKMESIAAFTEYTFDIFMLESILPMMCGMKIIIPTKQENANPANLMNLLVHHKVDVLQMTPSRLRMFLNVDSELEKLKMLKFVLIGGEALTLDLLKSLQRKTKAEVYNMYGPTETTVWSSISCLTNVEEINIGKPILNTNIYIIDENMNLVNDCEMGEICIGGAGLSKGYMNDETLTAKAFVRLPATNEIVYKTGDYGLFDGENFRCLGRIDNQVKVNGHRIELEEIEYYVNMSDEVAECQVAVHNSQIIAFYHCKKDLDSDSLKDKLKEALPQYMVPSIYVRTEGFVHNSNGKLDRKKSFDQNIVLLDNKPNGEVQCRDDVLSTILRIIEEIVMFSVNAEDKITSIFFDSLLYTQAIVEFEDVFDIKLDDDILAMDYFKSPVDISDYIRNMIGDR